MPAITPFLWFDTQAEEAATLYCSVFKNSRILKTTRYTAAGPGPAGSVMTIEFELDGQRFIALNAGPIYTFTEAVSFVIDCDTQADIDHYWSRLTADGGRESQCGWLKDKFGLSWQVVPTTLGQLMATPGKAGTVMQALLAMKKIDLAALKNAAAG